MKTCEGPAAGFIFRCVAVYPASLRDSFCFPHRVHALTLCVNYDKHLAIAGEHFGLRAGLSDLRGWLDTADLPGFAPGSLSVCVCALALRISRPINPFAM